MEELGTALYAAEREVFGLVRVFSDDEDEDPDISGGVSDETASQLLHTEKLLADPHFLSK